MKAVIVEKYGAPTVAHLQEVSTPTIKNPKDICIKIRSTSVSSGDARIRRADPWYVRIVFGLFGPRAKILGGVFAGVVSSIGTDVTQYKAGDRVYGMSKSVTGCHAEYIVVTENTPMGIMPKDMTFEDAASLAFGATTALHFLKDLDLKNKSILINGASGAVGVCFTQIARSRGAHVTAVTSTKNSQALKELGAETVIPYDAADILSSPQEYDIVIDCVNKIPIQKIENMVKQGGNIVLLAGLLKESLQSMRIKKAKVLLGTARPTHEQFEQISQLYIQKLLHPVTQAIFTLEEIASAYTIVDSGNKLGSIVIQIPK